MKNAKSMDLVRCEMRYEPSLIYNCLNNFIRSTFMKVIFVFSFLVELSCSEIEIKNSYNYEKSTSDVRQIQFADILKEKERLTSFTEGCSTSKIYKIELGGHPYVLRLNDPSLSIKNKQEAYVLREAAKAGIAPCVYYVSNDNSVVLMEYIVGEISTIELAKEKKNIINVALALRKAHDIPHYSSSSDTTVFQKMMDHYNLLKNNGKTFRELDCAIDKLLELKKNLDEFYVPCVTIHGDLHSGNIFFMGTSAKFIDWAETGCEDPFYDLSCFALCHNFEEEEEHLLLNSYLGKTINVEQKTRYEIIKRMDYIYFSVELFFISYELSSSQGLEIDHEKPISDWLFYISRFTDQENRFSSQFFYEFGHCALNKFLGVPD